MVDILLIASNAKMVTRLASILQDEAMGVTTVKPHDTLSRLDRQDSDIVILDLDTDGTTRSGLCREIRDRTTAPLLLLTENGQEAALARGLEAGADAYLVKPFTIRVFLAQVYALLRRIGLFQTGHTGQLATDGLTIDLRRREVSVYGRPVQLTPTEYHILSCLVRNSGRPLSYRSLVKEVHGYECDRREASDILKVHVHNLRRKIERRLDEPRFIRTVRDFGYMFERRRQDRGELDRSVTEDE